MARVDLTTEQIIRAGLTLLPTEPTADGDVMDCGEVALMVTNGSLASINVTVDATATVDGQAVTDLIVAVPAGATKLIGPFPARTFGQLAGADKGRAYVNYSAQTDVDRVVVSF